MYSIMILVSLSNAVASMGPPGRGGEFDGPRSIPGNQVLTEEPSPASSAGQDAGLAAYIDKTRGVLIAHAVMASMACAFFWPMASILLRLNINHPIILKLHVGIQLFAYVLLVASSIMGIWIAIETQGHFDIWADPHLIIGLIILIAATAQPILGQVHHRIYKSRAETLATTHRGPRPGRTIWSRFHVWLGRCLITLGVINGGLGLRIMESSPVQDPEVTRDAEIGYGVAAGLIWCVYAAITAIWEGNKFARQRKQSHQSSRSTQGEKLDDSSRNSTSLPPEPDMHSPT